MTQLHNKIFRYRPLCVTINNKELHLIHCYIAVVIIVESYVVNPSESNEYFQPFLFFYFTEKKKKRKNTSSNFHN